jgi:MSHA type pilus biogenesis protein MshL
MLTASCDTKSTLFRPSAPDLIDPAMELDREAYRNPTETAKKDGEDKPRSAAGVVEPPVPDLAEILAAPKPPKLGETKLVSIAVTDDVPLKDVLIELARLADVDIEVDAGITGGISFRAKDRPFNEVIDRIADLASLRYTMKNSVLRVERDTPYVQIYSLDFLNIERSSQSQVSISTNVLSAGVGGEGGGGGINTGSSSSVTSTAESDFWKQFEESVKQILAYNESKRISSVDISSQPPSPIAAPAAAGGATGEPVGPNSTPRPAPAAAAPAPAAPSGPLGGAVTPGVEGGAFYIMNRQASTLTVSATDKQHTLLKEFIRKIQANASAQVLIEAKIVEVTLNDQFQSGINWNRFGSDKISFSSVFGAVTQTNAASTFNFGTPHQLAFTKNIDLSAAVRLAQTFGTTRTLSSPRLHAINNQQSVLTFAENHVYFELNVEQNNNATTIGTVSTVTVNSTLHTVPIGIILTLQPSINLDTDEVTLSVRPTLSRITDNVDDPAVAFLVAQSAAAGTPINITNQVPVIEVRELDSILKLRSGQVMVIGGLMQDTANSNDRGLPGASTIPYFGHLFNATDKTNTMQELVIFIRATIVDSGGDATNADKTVYQKFFKDPRPLNF